MSDGYEPVEQPSATPERAEVRPGLTAPQHDRPVPATTLVLPDEVFDLIEMACHDKGKHVDWRTSPNHRAFTRKIRFLLASLITYSAQPGVQPLIDEIEEILRP